MARSNTSARLLESHAVLLIGTLPSPITSTPLVLVIYVVLILMLGGALASVLLRNLRYAIAAFAGTMMSVALLYLFIQPYSSARALLFGVQLVAATAVPALLMLGLLRRTSGLERPPSAPYGREVVAASLVTAALLALLVVVLGMAVWPIRIAPDLFVGLGRTITDAYVVSLAVLLVLLLSSALGVWLLLGQRGERRPVSQPVTGQHSKRRPEGRRDA